MITHAVGTVKTPTSGKEDIDEISRDVPRWEESNLVYGGTKDSTPSGPTPQGSTPPELTTPSTTLIGYNPSTSTVNIPAFMSESMLYDAGIKTHADEPHIDVDTTAKQKVKTTSEDLIKKLLTNYPSAFRCLPMQMSLSRVSSVLNNIIKFKMLVLLLDVSRGNLIIVIYDQEVNDVSDDVDESNHEYIVIPLHLITVQKSAKDEVKELLKNPVSGYINILIHDTWKTGTQLRESGIQENTDKEKNHYFTNMVQRWWGVTPDVPRSDSGALL